MDWLKEQQHTFCGSILLYIFMGFLGAGAFSMFTFNLCMTWIKVITTRTEEVRKFNKVVNYSPGIMDLTEEMQTKILLQVQFWSVIFFFGAAMVIVIHLYYRNRILPVLGAVAQTADNVRKGELEMPVAYKGGDQLGSICAQVEQIRLVLAEEKRNQREALERQLQLNGAFAHDIRTPLTVIKGYTEFLEKYFPAGKLDQSQVLEKLAAMKEQEERLFAFTNTMSAIQNLEKRQMQQKNIRLSRLMEAVKRQMEGILPGTGSVCVEIKLLDYGFESIDFYSSHEGEQKEGGGKVPEAVDSFLDADQEMIMESLENIWSNALNFARSKVEIIFQMKDGYLQVYVRDDGPGFSQRALTKGTEAYYRETDYAGEHFGLGLTLSSILCERHGGCITIVNSLEGGAIVTASFQIFKENL